ncbi:MAG: hypothetical protein Hens3KO_14420 [Henriciella sp.]
MFLLFKALSNASVKIVATFFMVLFLILFGILFVPSAYNGVNDFANWIANLDAVRNPDFGEQGKALMRQFINEASIFGIIMTLIARMIVEVIWAVSAALWRLVNPAEDTTQTSSEAPQNTYYN